MRTSYSIKAFSFLCNNQFIIHSKKPPQYYIIILTQTKGIITDSIKKTDNNTVYFNGSMAMEVLFYKKNPFKCENVNIEKENKARKRSIKRKK